MKKKCFIILLFICLIIFTGCGNKKDYVTTLNLNKTAIKLENLTYEKNGKNIPIFYNMTVPSDEEIKNIYKLNKEDFNEIIIKQSALSSKSSLFIIANVKEENKEKVKEALDKYMINYEKIWKEQDRTEYNLVLNRTFYENGNYFIYVISYDNNEVMDTILSLFEEKEK